MKFEVLKRSHLKRNIIIGIIVVVIISVIVLNFTRAKYKVTQSIPLVNGTINYTPYDFKMIAMYQENNSGTYDEIEIMPSAGYIINEEQSYCEINNEKDNNVKLTTINGNHTIANLKKGSKCYLYFELKKLTIQDIILDKKIQTRTNFSETLMMDTTGILYQANDNYGITYYYAGNPSDNWIKFAGFYWRIIRINGDGTIRMIYQGTSANTTGNGTQINTAPFNNSNADNMYVGYEYAESSVHGIGTNSNVKNILENWYQNNIANTEYDKLVVSGNGATFCNDRNVVYGTGLERTGTNYSGYQRLQINKTPTFMCETKEDKFDEKVGLITGDEVSYAGGVHATNNSNYFLNTNQSYWTMTPMYFHATTNRACVVFVNANGGMNNSTSGIYSVTETYGIRPVINLKSDVTISSGDGTASNPYVIEA